MKILDILLIFFKQLCNLIIIFSICYLVKDFQVNNLLIVIIGLLVMLNLRIEEKK